MRSFLPCIPLASTVLLTACGGSSSGLPIINSDGAALATDEGSVSLVTNELDVALDLNADFDRGPFRGASDLNADGEGQILGFAEGDLTFAAFLLNREVGASANSFFGRSGVAPALPTGQATLTGTYIGAFINETEDTTRSFIEGEATLDIDLDEMTIEGGVTNMTSDLFQLGLPFELSEEFDIVFPQAIVRSDGTFAALGERSVIDEEDGQETIVATDWSGLLGGETFDDLEVVGRVDTVATTEGVSGISSFVATARQSGVFVVGHEQ